MHMLLAALLAVVTSIAIDRLSVSCFAGAVLTNCITVLEHSFFLV